MADGHHKSPEARPGGSYAVRYHERHSKTHTSVCFIFALPSPCNCAGQFRKFERCKLVRDPRRAGGCECIEGIGKFAAVDRPEDHHHRRLRRGNVVRRVRDEPTRVIAETLASRAAGVKKVIDELTLSTDPAPAATGDPAMGTNPNLQSDGTMAPTAPQSAPQSASQPTAPAAPPLYRRPAYQDSAGLSGT